MGLSDNKYLNIDEYMKMEEDEISKIKNEKIFLEIQEQYIEDFRKDKKVRDKVIKHLEKMHTIQIDLLSINDYTPGEFKELYIDEKGNKKTVQVYFKDMGEIETCLFDVDKFIKEFDKVARKLNKEYEDVKEKLKDEGKAELNKSYEEIYKLLIIYKYMLQNMLYDIFFKEQSLEMPYSFFKKKDNRRLDHTQNGYGVISGKSVCNGFAYIFVNLAYRMGVDVKKVKGVYLLDNGQMNLHGWIEKEIEGKNYFLNISYAFEATKAKEKLFKTRKWEIPVFTTRKIERYFALNENGKWEKIKIHEKSLMEEIGEKEFYEILNNIKFFEMDKKQIKKLEKIQKEMDEIVEKESPLDRFLNSFYDVYLDEIDNIKDEQKIKEEIEEVLKIKKKRNKNNDKIKYKKAILHIEEQKQFIMLIEILSEYSIKELKKLHENIKYIIVHLSSFDTKELVRDKESFKKQLDILIDNLEEAGIVQDSIVYIIKDDPDIYNSIDLINGL